MDHVMRVVRADEWEKVRELRLAALRDPVANLAFLETYEEGLARPESFWKERTANAAEDGPGAVRQFVAEAPDGRWVGTATVLLERAGAETYFGDVPKTDQTHVVGVYVRDEARGSGVIDALFAAAAEWSWSLTDPRIERVRLYAHVDNERARAVYRRIGFETDGVPVALPGSEVAHELEYELLRPGD
jgi:RimJ/RimL family protein N-acetyltransferase